MNSIGVRLGLVAMLCGSAVAQTAQAPLSFEVASIREVPEGTKPVGNNNLFDPFSDRAPVAGIVKGTGPVLGYILFAYNILDGSQFMKLNQQMPAWAQKTAYSLEARADGEPTRDQLRLMMRTLLKERFKLEMHTETKDLPVLSMAFEKPGEPGKGLRVHPAEVVCVTRTDSFSSAKPAAEGAAPYCGMNVRPVNGQLRMKMVDVTMEQVTGLLGGLGSMLGDLGNRPLVDKTGLKGRYDMEIEFLPPMMAMGNPDAQGATFEEALKSQLGVKLVKETGPVTTYTIDHVERPSVN